MLIVQNPGLSGSQTGQLNTGFRTILDLDFTSLTTQSLGTDGTKTLSNGQVCKKFQSAGDSVAMAITNGTGLVIQPVAATDDNGSITAPQLFFPFSAMTFPIAPAWCDTFRIWVYNSADNITADFDSACWSINRENTQILAYQFARCSDGGKGFDASACTNAARQYLQHIAATLSNSNRVCMSQISLTQPLFWNQVFAGAASGGGVWPALSALGVVNVASLNSAAPWVSVISNLNAGELVTDHMGVSLYAKRASSATALSITFARLRVDWAPGFG